MDDSLRLEVYPSPQVLQTDGRLCHVAPASRVAEGIAEQQGPFAPRRLIRFLATTGPSETLSPSAAFPRRGYTAYLAPLISQRDEEGFSSCSTRPLSPCRRYHPAGRIQLVSQTALDPAAFNVKTASRPPVLGHFEATCAFTFVAAR